MLCPIKEIIKSTIFSRESTNKIKPMHRSSPKWRLVTRYVSEMVTVWLSTAACKTIVGTSGRILRKETRGGRRAGARLGCQCIKCVAACVGHQCTYDRRLATRWGEKQPPHPAAQEKGSPQCAVKWSRQGKASKESFSSPTNLLRFVLSVFTQAETLVIEQLHIWVRIPVNSRAAGWWVQ